LAVAPAVTLVGKLATVGTIDAEYMAAKRQREVDIVRSFSIPASCNDGMVIELLTAF
jgi:hypothetical protein